MKIVVATQNNAVSAHFGHCEAFTAFNAENGAIVSTEIIEYPGHRPGYLPKYLSEKGANVIIAGGMGSGAVDLFNEYKIEVITGATGDMKTAVESYLKGELKSSGSVCHEHSFEENC